MSTYPLPVRLAAGLVAIALERARSLPQDVSEWPMTAVSQAMQISMRVQQRITDLAIKGDEALASLREPEEEPPWAVFDEDLPRPSYLRPHAVTEDTASEDSAAGRAASDVPVLAAAFEDEEDGYGLAGQDSTTAEEQSWFEAIDEVNAQPAAAAEPEPEPAAALEPEPAAAELEPEPAAAVPEPEPAVPETEPAAAVHEPEPAAAALEPEPVVAVLEPERTAAVLEPEPAAAEPAPEPASTPESALTAGLTAAPEPPVALPGYPRLSLASVRGRLRGLTVADLEELLAYERGHGNRPEFVRILTNRIATVRGTR
jgi:hypothetical protein